MEINSLQIETTIEDVEEINKKIQEGDLDTVISIYRVSNVKRNLTYAIEDFLNDFYYSHQFNEGDSSLCLTIGGDNFQYILENQALTLIISYFHSKKMISLFVDGNKLPDDFWLKISSLHQISFTINYVSLTNLSLFLDKSLDYLKILNGVSDFVEVDYYLDLIERQLGIIFDSCEIDEGIYLVYNTLFNDKNDLSQLMVSKLQKRLQHLNTRRSRLESFDRVVENFYDIYQVFLEYGYISRIEVERLRQNLEIIDNQGLEAVEEFKTEILGKYRNESMLNFLRYISKIEDSYFSTILSCKRTLEILDTWNKLA